MSHRRNNSMKYNFNIYGLSGAGTVVDVALVGDPLGGASQVRLRGHVVFRREAGEVQPIVVLPAPNNGKPYSLEQGNPVRFLDKLQFRQDSSPCTNLLAFSSSASPYS